MSTHYLGASFDIHCGGQDLIFPHHEDEIAQSRAAGYSFARYWMHNGFLNINNEKMSKSLGNHIPLISSPEDMYGKVMSIPDAAMGAYFRLVTRWTPTEIEEIEAGMASGMLHPRDVKMQLAREIVEIYHGEQAGEPAETAFRRVFQKREIPENLAEITLKPGQTLVDVMLQAEFVSSLSEARRLIKQGGVRLDGATQDDQRKVLDIPKSQVLRVGKRRFVRLLPPEK